MPRAAKSSKTKVKRPRVAARARRNRLTVWLFIGMIVVVLVALPAYRWMWRRRGANAVRTGLELFEHEGCVACHRTGTGALRWRADGAAPASLEVIRDAVVNGRPEEAGFGVGDMPAYGSRLTVRKRNNLALAVGVLTGLAGIPEDPELAAGHDIARQMECFRCHGPLGSGGVANPGSLSGAVPGWMRPDAGKALSSPDAFAALLQSGATPKRVPLPWVPGPVLRMPAFGPKLDSTETDLLRRYLVWLHNRSFAHR